MLYFAQYIITEVDEDAKKRALEHLQKEMDDAPSTAARRENADRIVEIEARPPSADRHVEADREAALAAGRRGAHATPTHR